MATEGTVTETFERYEFKYWAPLPKVQLAVAMLDGFMVEDDNSKKAGGQINTSLYFDSRHFTFLEQHVAGLPDRIKLRVRYYGTTPSGPMFFEIKRRQVAVVMKRRAVVPLEQARAWLGDFTQPVPVQNETLDDFQYLALRCQAEPKLLVRARRQAFRAAEKGVDVRLTIDSDVAWQPPRGPDFLVPREDRWRHIEGLGDARPKALIEVKFRSDHPWWLGQVTQLLAPWRVSFSKYVAAALAAREDPFFTLDAA
jgi:hypothetical protein